MPKITKEDKTPVTNYSVKLRVDVQEMLEKYAAFAESSVSHVVTESLRLVFADKDFQDYLSSAKGTKDSAPKKAAV